MYKYIQQNCFSDDSHLRVFLRYLVILPNFCNRCQIKFSSLMSEYVTRRASGAQLLSMDSPSYKIMRKSCCKIQLTSLTQTDLIDQKHLVVGRMLMNLVTRAQTQKIKPNKRDTQLLKRKALSRESILIFICKTTCVAQQHCSVYIDDCGHPVRLQKSFCSSPYCILFPTVCEHLAELLELNLSVVCYSISYKIVREWSFQNFS